MTNKLNIRNIITFVCWIFIVIQTTPTHAGTMIFDDDYGDGWAKGSWDVYINTEYTYNQSKSSVLKTRGVSFNVTNPEGMVISDTPILQAYINFLVDEEKPGHSITNVKVDTIDGTLFEFDDRSKGWICYLDGTEYIDAAEVVFDTNPDTWQLFEIDLSQIDYFGWPYQSRQLSSTPITSIGFSSYGSLLGETQMLADNVQIIPEPATLALLGLGGLLLRRRKHS